MIWPLYFNAPVMILRGGMLPACLALCRDKKINAGII